MDFKQFMQSRTFRFAALGAVVWFLLRYFGAVSGPLVYLPLIGLLAFMVFGQAWFARYPSEAFIGRCVLAGVWLGDGGFEILLGALTNQPLFFLFGAIALLIGGWMARDMFSRERWQ
jgi:hypothetical protein